MATTIKVNEVKQVSVFYNLYLAQDMVDEYLNYYLTNDVYKFIICFTFTH